MRERSKLPRFGVDVDGVLADLHTPCFELASKILGREVSMEHLKSWDFDTLLPKDSLEDFWFQLGAPGICRSLQPYPEALVGMRELQKVADVYIVTSYLHDAVQWVHERDQWIYEHFGIPRSKMVHTKAKYTFNGKALVDDKPQNIEEWAEENPMGTPVLWLQPYNANTRFKNEVEARVLRTNNWDRLVTFAAGLGSINA